MTLTLGEEIEMAHYPCDLHTHTICSDGQDTYIELLNNAKKAELQVVAITDHDIRPLETITVNGIEMTPESYAQQLGIVLLRGIEISCDTYVEDVHIVGIGCDFEDARFVQLEAKISDSKIGAYRELANRLSKYGSLTWQDVLANAGRPLAENEVQRKHIFEAMARHGYAEDWARAKLLVKNSPEYQILREKPSPEEAIQLILDTGGIPILAHPFLIEENPRLGGKVVTREKYIDNLINNGLVGIEASYPYEKTSYHCSVSSEEIEILVRKKYEDILPLISGGSDYHNDERKGVHHDKARQLGEKGITLEYFQNNDILQKLVSSA